MLILDLLGISFHAVVVFALGKNLLFDFALGHCVKDLVKVSLVSPNLLLTYSTSYVILILICIFPFTADSKDSTDAA